MILGKNLWKGLSKSWTAGCSCESDAESDTESGHLSESASFATMVQSEVSMYLKNISKIYMWNIPGANLRFKELQWDKDLLFAGSGWAAVGTGITWGLGCFPVKIWVNL